MFKFSNRFRVTFLLLIHGNSQAVTFPTSISTSKLWVSFQPKCHTSGSIYVFLSHLICGTLCYCLYQSLTFFFLLKKNAIYVLKCCTLTFIYPITPMVFFVWFCTVGWFLGTHVLNHSRAYRSYNISERHVQNLYLREALFWFSFAIKNKLIWEIK